MENKKEITAAITAVLYYIKTEEEMQAQLAARQPAAQPAVTFKPWGFSGRQAQMQMRTLMQMRTFR